MIQYYVDEDGFYLGAFDGITPDDSFEVPEAPEDSSQIWDFDLEEWSAYTAPKNYLIYSYVPNFANSDPTLWPGGVDFGTALNQVLFPKHTFSGGVLESTTWYADKVYDEDLMEYVYSVPIVIENYSYDSDIQTKESQWYFTDETLDDAIKTEEQILVDNPVLHEIKEEGGIPVNMIKNLGTPTEDGDSASKGYVDDGPGGTEESIRDIVAAFIQNGTGLNWTHNDPGDTLTGNVTLSPFSTTDLAEGTNLYFTNERVDDEVNTLIQDAGGIRKSYNDAGNQLTLQTAFATQLFSINDEKAQNTDGGTFASGAWRTRDLNTIKTNEITGASLSANQITLPAGTYYCTWSCPASNNSASAKFHQSRLYNITDSSVIILGAHGEVAQSSIIRVFGGGRFTISGTKVIEIQHIIDSTVNSIGFGEAGDLATEIYSQISIWRLY